MENTPQQRSRTPTQELQSLRSKCKENPKRSNYTPSLRPQVGKIGFSRLMHGKRLYQAQNNKQKGPKELVWSEYKTFNWESIKKQTTSQNSHR